MYRFKPNYALYARPIDHYPARCKKAAAIMLMIQNNLDPAVAQHPRRTYHLWRQWGRIPELGSISINHAVFGHYD